MTDRVDAFTTATGMLVALRARRISARELLDLHHRRSGLPIGVHVIGPYLEDRTPLRFGALLARELGGFKRPPGYDAD